MESIMDIVDNTESMYSEKIAMFDRWVEAGDTLSRERQRLEAMELAVRFEAWLGRRSGAVKAAREMLEEFPQHQEFAIQEAMERAAAKERPAEPMTPEEVEYAEKMEALSRKIGIDRLALLIPVPRSKIQKALERGDKHLNTIPLYKWDGAASAIHDWRELGLFSQSQVVGALKHVAKWHYA